MGFLRAFVVVLFFPAVVAHELAHWSVGRLGARDATLRICSTHPTYTVDEWREDIGLLIVLAAYAPLLVGGILGVLFLGTVLITGWWPESGRETVIVLLGGGYWLMFMTPSASDIATAQEGIDRARE